MWGEDSPHPVGRDRDQIRDGRRRPLLRPDIAGTPQGEGRPAKPDRCATALPGEVRADADALAVRLLPGEPVLIRDTIEVHRHAGTNLIPRA